MKFEHPKNLWRSRMVRGTGTRPEVAAAHSSGAPVAPSALPAPHATADDRGHGEPGLAGAEHSAIQVEAPVRVVPRSFRNRLARRALKLAIALVALLVITVVAGLGYVQWRFSQIDRIEIEKGALDKIGEPSVNAPTLEFPTGDGAVFPTETTVSPLAGVPTSVAAVARPGTTLPPDTTIPAAPSTLPTAVVSTIPGEGSGDDDPALAGAPDDTTPVADLPTGDAPIVDTQGIVAIGGPRAYNTLIIGTDSRADVTAEDARTFGKGRVTGKRSDTIMVARTDPSTGQAALLSFPRDLYVHIAGTKRNDRINAAYARSITTLVNTLKENFGIPINHVVEVDFNGFQSVVGTLGGVEIDFPKAARDVITGLNQPAGRNLLDPKQAVAYVRSRHYETGANGKWTPDGRGDLGRVVRQQSFIRAVLQRAMDQGARNPLTANALLVNFTNAIKLDSTFTLPKLAELAASFRSFDPATLAAQTVPGIPARIDKKAVLRVDKAKAAKVVGKFGRRAR